MQPGNKAALLPISLILLVLALASSWIGVSPSLRQAFADRWHVLLRAGRPGNSGEQAEQVRIVRAAGWYARGQSARSGGDLLGAANAWENALLFGAPPDAIYPLLADAHGSLGDLDGLAADLKALVSLDPDEPSWQYRLGLVQLILQPEAAREHLLSAAESDPALVESVRLLERGLSLSQVSTDPAFRLVALGRALASTGEWQLAEVAFTKATRLNPGYAEAWAFLGEARRQLGKDGLQELLKAASIDNQSVAANTLLGLHWQQSGRLDLALAYLDAAARQEPENSVLQTALGEVLARQGNLPAALQHYQQAAKAAPRDPEYWRYLAVFTIEHNIQVKEIGLPAARTAVLLDEKDPISLDTMAQVYFSLGYPLIARRFLQKALAVDPDFAAAHLHLGLVNLVSGDVSAARRQFHLAETLAPAGSQTSDQVNRLLLNLQP